MCPDGEAGDPGSIDPDTVRTQRVSRSRRGYGRALKADLWLPPLTAQTCNGASDKEYDKYLLSPHTTLDSHPAKDKVRNGFAWAPGLPRRARIISAALIKRLGPSGQFPHSSLRPSVAGTRAEAHGPFVT